jgi:PAS domain S-box-containing protein
MNEHRHKDRAERIVRSDPVELENLSDDEVQAILHELKVQRIAAELQNEELRDARNTLERSRNEFRELFERAPTGYVVLDRHGIIYRANPFFAHLVERERKAIIGRSLMEFLSEPDQHVFRSRFRAVFQVPDGKQLVARLRVPPEEPRVVRIELSRTREFITAQANEAEFALTAITDITVLTRKERELAASMERYRLLFESGVDAKYVHQLNNGSMGTFLEVSDGACRQLGYTRAELLEMRPDDIDSAEASQAAARHVRDLMEKGHVVFEGAHRAKSGETVPVEISAHLFTLDGCPTVLSIARDISRRVKAERERQEKEAYLSSVLRAMNDYLLVIDENYVIRDANQSFLLHVGLPRDQVVGMHCYELSHGLHGPCEHHGQHCPLREVIRTGRPAVCNHVHTTKNGTDRTFELSLARLPTPEGETARVVETGRDVTQLALANRLLERNALSLRLRTSVYDVLITHGEGHWYAALVAAVCSNLAMDAGWFAVPTDDQTLTILGERPELEETAQTRSVRIDRCGSLIGESIRNKMVKTSTPDTEPPFPSACGPAFAQRRYGISMPIVDRGAVVAHLLFAGHGPILDGQADELLNELSSFLSRIIADRLELDRQERLRVEAEQQIESSLREKEVLLREVHHRVKNNLQVVSSLLGMAADRSNHQEVAAALGDSQSRVLAMALIHETMYRTDDFSSIDLRQYLGRIVSSVEAALSDGGRIRFLQAIEPVTIDIDRALPLGIIANELLSNAAKHGFGPDDPGTVELGLRCSTYSATLTVRDSGRGFEQNVEPNASSSLGLLLVRILTEQIGGTCRYRHDQGTAVEIEFRLPSDPTGSPPTPS